MTKQELEELNPFDFTVLILQERLYKLNKQDTPLGRKLSVAIAAVQEAKKKLCEVA